MCSHFCAPQTSEYEEKKEVADPAAAAAAGKDKKGGAAAASAAKDKKGGAAAAAAPVAPTSPPITFTFTALYSTLPPPTASDLAFNGSLTSLEAASTAVAVSPRPASASSASSSSSSSSVNFDLARIVISTPVVELARAAWSELRHAVIQSQTLAKARLNVASGAVVPEAEFITQDHLVRIFTIELIIERNLILNSFCDTFCCDFD